eukprot:Clim_evm53s214 gene=Clim_evmTU53s214
MTVIYWIIGYIHSELHVFVIPLKLITLFIGLGLGVAGASKVGWIASWLQVASILTSVGLWLQGLRAHRAAARLADTMSEHYDLDIPRTPWENIKQWFKFPVPNRKPHLKRHRDIIYLTQKELEEHEHKPLKAFQLDLFHLRDGEVSQYTRSSPVQTTAGQQTHGKGRPILMFIHGGAWISGTKDFHSLPHLYSMAEEGWLVATVNYRLAPKYKYPAHLIDCKRALRWIKEHAREYGGDPDFICVSGGSAGGHLASMMAVSANDPAYQPGFENVDTTVRACVAWYPVMDVTHSLPELWPTDISRFWSKVVMGKDPKNDHEAFVRASPRHLLHPDVPPMLVLAGDNDNLVPVEHLREFVGAYNGIARQPLLYYELEGAHHAWDALDGPRTFYSNLVVAGFLRTIHMAYISQSITDPNSLAGVPRYRRESNRRHSELEKGEQDDDLGEPSNSKKRLSDGAEWDTIAENDEDKALLS